MKGNQGELKGTYTCTTGRSPFTTDPVKEWRRHVRVSERLLETKDLDSPIPLRIVLRDTDRVVNREGQFIDR